MEKKRRFIPYPLSWDDMPIDLSYIFEDEKPAGKHGFLQVKDGRMVFADGTEARFWGVGFQGSSMFPSFACSEIVARRLAKVGVNIVRLHQMDAEWATPNLFQLTKGKPLENTRNFDDRSLKLLDYLIYCLKQEGIYILIENLSYRKFKEGDGLENAQQLTEGAKPYACFARKLIDLQKEFIEKLWNHQNPYTSLAYKDEPAIACSNLSNESGLTCVRSHDLKTEPYRSELESRYEQWQKDHHFSDIRTGGNFANYDERSLDFFIDLEKEYYQEIIDFMHGIGVKVPVTGTNWINTAGSKKAMLVCDYDEQHEYWMGRWALWRNGIREFSNQSMTRSIDNRLGKFVMGRSLDRPLLITEWLDPQPNEWRAESIPYIAAITAFQDWSGFMVHAYRYHPAMKDSGLYKDFYPNAIGNFFIREGKLSIYNDPALFGLFYCATLLYRRRDVKPAVKTLDVCLDYARHYPEKPGLLLAGEKHRAGVVLDKMDSKADLLMDGESSPPEMLMGEVLSDTGELYRNWEKGYGTINTPRTKVVYGFWDKTRRLSLGALDLHIENDFAVLALSSLTQEPVEHASHLLLTAVGRSENTGTQYNDEHTVLLEAGTMPVLAEVIHAGIRLETDAASLTVWSISPEGFYQGIIPSKIVDGCLEFTIGELHESIYYMIVSR